MTQDLHRHRRRSIRLKGYDYTQPGAYFVTVCTQDRACLFGEVMHGEMRLNDAGRMVERWWGELNRKFPHIRTDAFAVMPNHIHGIIVIEPVGVEPVGADLRVCPDQRMGAHVGAPLPGDVAGTHANAMGAHAGAPLPGDVAGTHANAMGAHIGAPLPEIVQWFKTMTTSEYIRGVKQSHWTAFRGRLWQRNYYEHIIRSDGSLGRIRQYIAENPLRWAFDRENPRSVTLEPEDL
jgi:REP element-mobilizing transposase RayT